MNRRLRARILLALLAAAAGVGSGAPSGARAAEPATDSPPIPDASIAEASDSSAGRAAWEPRFNLGFGILTQPHRGEGIVPTQTSTTTLEASGDSLIAQHFDFGLDLLTPLQLSVPGRPRLVLTSGFQTPLGRSLISNRADLRFDAFPPSPGFADNCPPTVGSVATSTCSVSLRNRTSIDYLWTAGFGVDFTLPFDEEQFHFTQGFEYIGMAAQAEGRYTRRSTGIAGVQQGNTTEFIDAKGDLELYHGISITETFSVDAYEEGPWIWSFFMEGRMSWFATDRDMSVSETSTRGTFLFVSSLNDPEPIQYQLIGGVSVRFDPRDW